MEPDSETPPVTTPVTPAAPASPGPAGRASRVLRFASLPVIAAGLALFALVLAELLLALSGWGEAPAGGLSPPGAGVPTAEATLPDGELFYRLRPATTLLGAYDINRHGWRGPAYETVRQPGSLRVVCAGDSNTFGLAVDGDDAWPEQLRRILTVLLDGRLQVEVVNAGVPGYSTEQSLRQVRRDLLVFRPDVLVVCPTAHNDVSGCDYGGDRAALDGWAARLARLRVVRILGLARPDGASPEGPAPGGGARPRVTPREFEENVRAIVALARAERVPVVYVVTPHADERVLLQPELREHEALLLRSARGAGALTVDVRPDFEAYAADPMFSDGIHFLPLAHQLVALGVARAIAADVAPPAAGARRAFLRAWAAPWRAGSPAVPAPAVDDAPPLYVELHTALLQADVDARLLADDPALPEPLRRLDPVHGRERSPYGSGALCLQQLGASDAGRAAFLAGRREEIARCVQPPDPLLTRCGGPEAMSRLSREELAAARAFVVLDGLAGAQPPPRDRRVGMARAVLARDNIERGLALLDEAIALHPGHTDARYLRGLVLRRAGRYAEAEAEFAVLVADDPRAPLSLLVSGALARQRGELERAERDLRDALEADPSLSVARLELVRVHIQGGALDEAERLLQPGAGTAVPPGEADVLRAEIARRRARR